MWEKRQEVGHCSAASPPRVLAHVNPTRIYLWDQARCFLYAVSLDNCIYSHLRCPKSQQRLLKDSRRCRTGLLCRSGFTFKRPTQTQTQKCNPDTAVFFCYSFFFFFLSHKKGSWCGLHSLPSGQKNVVHWKTKLICFLWIKECIIDW